MQQIVPKGKIVQYPSGIALPVYREFKQQRSTIHRGHLELATFPLEISKDNPFITCCLKSDDGQIWWECDTQAKVWGKVDLMYLVWIDSSWMDEPSKKYVRHPYASSLQKYDYYEVIP